MLRMMPRHRTAGERETARMMAIPRQFHRGRIAEITSPLYDVSIDGKTVSIISNLNDAEGRPVGRLTAAVRFRYLMDAASATDLWQNHRAYLVDEEGNVMAGNTDVRPRRLGEQGDDLGKAAVTAMEEASAGAVMGEGHPPEEIIGFFRLHEAPWFLVISAPGAEVLGPVVRFRNYYLMGAAGFIMLILLLIRWVAGRMVVAIKSVSEAAREIAGGRLDHHLPVRSRDEVGELVASFNTMTRQLEERLHMKNSLNLAMEVQQNLLPSDPLIIQDLDIAGTSRYCDETGGDYYDFIALPEMGPGRIGVAVGDVSGHGVAAALLMTSVRAFIRSRVIRARSLPGMIGDVNRLLCMDTTLSGSFMTLFFLLMDIGSREIRWIRAGHEPAIAYAPASDAFTELKGRGMALGVDPESGYEEEGRSTLRSGEVILLATDGLWETENTAGEPFGRDRVKALLRQHHGSSSEEIVQAILDAHGRFRGDVPQTDDVTLVVVKRREGNDAL
jgi:sigma-B regulation protein RsbU (phosphoserine phosphatase)